MYSRGDIVSVNFPFTDGSQSKERPALIISNDMIAGTGDVVILMISSKGRADGIVLELTPELIISPLPKQSFVRCHRFFTMDAELILAKYSQVTPEGMNMILEKVVSIIS
jgi:mRNA interferase MazF